MHLHNYLQTIHSALLHSFAGATESEGSIKVAFLEKSYPSLYQNFKEWKYMFYDEKNFQSHHSFKV